MRSYKETKTIQYDASLLYSIIMDVENYPNFLPWCSYATILSKNEDYLEAELNITFKGVSESYVSRVCGSKYDGVHEIEVIGISGPFKFLQNNWVIESVNNGSEVKFSIDFELKSMILDMVVGVFFSTITERMVAAFEDRAKELSVQSVIL